MNPELKTFADRVYWLIDEVPSGKVATYGQIAFYAGSPGAARAVGTLLKKTSSIGLELPWHRIINSTGGIAFGADITRGELQRDLLESEGVEMSRKFKCKLSIYQWQPDSAYWG